MKSRAWYSVKHEQLISIGINFFYYKSKVSTE